MLDETSSLCVHYSIVVTINYVALIIAASNTDVCNYFAHTWLFSTYIINFIQINSERIAIINIK